MTHFNVSSTAPTARILHYCIKTAPRSSSIFRVTTFSTTACAIKLATVPSAYMMVGTASGKSRHAILCTTHIVLSTMRTGRATRAAMCQNVCGTDWIVFPRGTSPQAELSSWLLQLRWNSPKFELCSFDRLASFCTQSSPLLRTRMETT